jgi:hypothetical protein
MNIGPAFHHSSAENPAQCALSGAFTLGRALVRLLAVRMPGHLLFATPPATLPGLLACPFADAIHAHAAFLPVKRLSAPLGLKS